MRALIFPAVLCCALLLFPGRAEASGLSSGEGEGGQSFSYEEVRKEAQEAEEADTSLLEELDFTEIQQTVDEILGGDFQFKNTVLDLITGKQPFTLESFLEALID